MENELKKIESLLEGAKTTGYNQAVIDTVDWIKKEMDSCSFDSYKHTIILGLLDRYMNVHRKRFKE